jgi:hypothetical protein
MIEVKNLHLQLARLIGDYLTENGEEFVNGNEDGLQISYKERKSAIEGAFFELYNLLKQRGLENIVFLKEFTLNNPSYIIGHYTHLYSFPISTMIIDILNSKIGVSSLYTEVKPIKYFPGDNFLHIGTGVCYLETNYNGQINLNFLLPKKLHTSNPNEVSAIVQVHTIDGLGEYNKVLALDSSWENVILNLAYANLLKYRSEVR